MEKIVHDEIVEFIYDSNEEREAHVLQMQEEGWEHGGKFKRLKPHVSIWDATSDDYDWYASFYRNVSEKKITIDKSEYESLVEDSKFLNALQCAGVDNWSGYGEAYEIMENEEEEE